LDVDGDDATDLLHEFSIRFQVDISAINVDEYFGAEAAPGPIDFIVGLLKNSKSKSLKRLEIRHLVEAANSGKFV
jgi:hypothetical protein